MESEVNQEILFKLSMLEQNIGQLQEQLKAVESAIVEMGSLSVGLDEVVGGSGKDVFSPIGRGIYVRTKIVSEELLVDVGGKSFVNKSIPETKEIIKSQVDNLEVMKKQLIDNLGGAEQEFNDIVKDAEKESS